MFGKSQNLNDIATLKTVVSWTDCLKTLKVHNKHQTLLTKNGDLDTFFSKPFPYLRLKI